MWMLSDGSSLGNIVIGSLLVAAAIAVAFGPELMHGVQRRRSEPAGEAASAPVPASDRTSAAL